MSQSLYYPVRSSCEHGGVRVPDSGDPGAPPGRRGAARAGAGVGEDGARVPALSHRDPHHPLAGRVDAVVMNH